MIINAVIADICLSENRRFFEQLKKEDPDMS